MVLPLFCLASSAGVIGESPAHAGIEAVCWRCRNNHPCRSAIVPETAVRIEEGVAHDRPCGIAPLQSGGRAQVAGAVADGRAEIGNTNLTEFLPHNGVKVISPIPSHSASSSPMSAAFLQCQ